MPLGASTLATVLTFLAIALLPGNAGAFVGSLSTGVIFSLVFSFLLALTVVPAAAALLDRAPELQFHRPLAVAGVQWPALGRGFERLLMALLRRPLLGIALTVMPPLAGFVAATQLTQQMFPPAERDQFRIQIQLSPGTPIEEALAAARRANAVLAGHDGIRGSIWFLGRAAPRIYYNDFTEEQGVPHVMLGYALSSSPEATQRLVAPVQQSLRAAFPDALVFARQLAQGADAKAPIEARLIGRDLEGLRAAGEQVRALLAELPGVVATHATIPRGHIKAAVIAAPAVMRQTGRDLAGLAAGLNAGLDGIAGGAVWEGSEELPVRVRFDAGARAGLEDLRRLVLEPLEGGVDPVPLTGLASLELVPAASNITRRDGERVNAIRAFLLPDVLPAAYLEAFVEQLETADLRLPPGVRLELGGEAAELQQAQGDLAALAGPLRC